MNRLVWNYSAVDNKYLAFNSDGLCVGMLGLERVGSHMHWCWINQPLDVFMSPGCLDEVRDKQKELFANRKSENIENGI